MVIRYCDQCWTENDLKAQRCTACGASLQVPQGDWVDRLTRSLRHPIVDWRAFAAVLLGKTDDDRAVRALSEVAESEAAQGDLERLPAVAEALGRLGRPSSVGVLTKLAHDPFLGVRIAAAKALGALGTPEALAQLECMASSDPLRTVRERAEEILRRRSKVV